MAACPSATQVLPFFHILEWMVRWIVVTAAIGFPFWLAFAWFSEWTAEGLQRDTDSPKPLSPSSRASRRHVDRWIIVMRAAAVVLLLADKFVLRERTVQVAGVPEKSVAVLPFVNRQGAGATGEDRVQGDFAAVTRVGSPWRFRSLVNV